MTPSTSHASSVSVTPLRTIGKWRTIAAADVAIMVESTWYGRRLRCWLRRWLRCWLRRWLRRWLRHWLRLWLRLWLRRWLIPWLWRSTRTDIDINARCENLIRPSADPYPPQCCRTNGQVRRQLHCLGIILSRFPVVNLIVGIPKCVHISPIVDWVTTKAIFGLCLAMRTKLPLSLTVVICIQHHVGLEHTAWFISLSSGRVEKRKLTPRITRIDRVAAACATARACGPRFLIHCAEGVFSNVSADTPWAIRLTGKRSTNRLDNSSVSMGMTNDHRKREPCRKTQCVQCHVRLDLQINSM